MFKNKKLVSNIIIMTVIILYFLFEFLTFESDSDGFGLDNLISLVWIVKIIEFLIVMILVLISYKHKLFNFYKLLITLFFLYNTIWFILIFINNNPDKEVIITYVLPFVFSLFQIFKFGNLKNYYE